MGKLTTREHLTDGEVEKLIEAAGDNRHGHRDALMVLMAYRHGLRAAEVADLRWLADRLQNRVPARPQGQERHAEHPPVDRPRATRVAPAPEGGQVALRVRFGARCAFIGTGV